MRNRRRIKFDIAIAAVSLLVTLGFAGRLLAQSADDSDPMLKLYVDPRTHIVYTVPGRGRRLLTEVPASALATHNLEERQNATERKLDQNQARLAEMVARNQQLETSNEDL